MIQMGWSVPESRLDEIEEEQFVNEACMVLFTSGTTGPPKGESITCQTLRITKLAAQKFQCGGNTSDFRGAIQYSPENWPENCPQKCPKNPSKNTAKKSKKTGVDTIREFRTLLGTISGPVFGTVLNRAPSLTTAADRKGST